MATRPLRPLKTPPFPLTSVHNNHVEVLTATRRSRRGSRVLTLVSSRVAVRAWCDSVYCAASSARGVSAPPGTAPPCPAVTRAGRRSARGAPAAGARRHSRRRPPGAPTAAPARGWPGSAVSWRPAATRGSPAAATACPRWRGRRRAASCRPRPPAAACGASSRPTRH